MFFSRERYANAQGQGVAGDSLSVLAHPRGFCERLNMVETAGLKVFKTRLINGVVLRPFDENFERTMCRAS